MTIEIRHAEPADCAALQALHAQPRAIWGTLQLPYPSVEAWKKRLQEKPESMIQLVACKNTVTWRTLAWPSTIRNTARGSVRL